jgi:type II secretory pathway component PulF
MSVFAYRGFDSAGKEVRGVLDAPSRAVAVSKLKAQGVFPYEIKETTTKEPSISILPRKKVSSKDLAVFLKTLSTMLNAGVSLIDAITSFLEGTVYGPGKSFLTLVLDELKSGKSLRDALEKAGVSDPVLLNLVLSGEKGGLLPHSLGTCAQILSRREELKRIVVNALVYPAILLAVAVATVVFMLVVVVPKVASIYASAGVKLPLSTRIVLVAGNFLTENRNLLLLFLLLLVLLLLAISRRFKTTFDRWKLLVPIFGRLILYLELQRFFETLSGLLSAGIHITDAIPASAGTVRNTYLRACLTSLRKAVEKGTSLHTAISSAGIAIPGPILHLIRTGEESGDLPDMLREVSAFLSREVNFRLNTLTSLIEPVVLLVVGVVVGFVVYSLLLPIAGVGSIVNKV